MVSERSPIAQCAAICEAKRLELLVSAKEARERIPELPIFDQMLECGCIDLNTKQRLVLAFQEAFTNSLDHGSLELPSLWKDEFDSEGQDIYTKKRQERLGDPSFAERKIRVVVEGNADSVKISIADEGPGFMLSNTCDTLLRDGPVSFHGRGLAIIGSIMDQVFFNEEGTEVTMIKFLK